MKWVLILPATLALMLSSCSTVQHSQSTLSGTYVLDGRGNVGSNFIFHEDGTFQSEGKQYKDWLIRGAGPGTFSVEHGIATLTFSNPPFSHLTQKFIIRGDALVATGGDRGGSMYKDGARFIKRSEPANAR